MLMVLAKIAFLIVLSQLCVSEPLKYLLCVRVDSGLASARVENFGVPHP